MEFVIAELLFYILAAFCIAVFLVVRATYFSLKQVFKSALNWKQAPYRNTFRLLSSAFGIGAGVFVGVWQGMALGGLIGSLVPGIGTLAGAITGGVIGGIFITGIVSFLTRYCAKQLTRYISYQANQDNPDAISKTNPHKYQLSEEQKQGFHEKGTKLLDVKKQLTDCRALKNHPTLWEGKHHEKRKMFNGIIRDLKEADKYENAVQKLSNNTPEDKTLIDKVSEVDWLDRVVLEISKPW